MQIDSTALVCADSNLAGNIVFGPLCVVHPQVTVIAQRGEILLGAKNVLEEQCVLRCTKEQPLVVGDGNVFLTRSQVVDCQVGAYCVIGEGAKLTGCTLVGGNFIAPMVDLQDVVLERDVWVVMRDGKTVLINVPESQKTRVLVHDTALQQLTKVIALNKLRKA